MRQKVKILLKVLYALFGLSLYLAVTMGIPYIVYGGAEGWWQVGLIFTFGFPAAFVLVAIIRAFRDD